jgi:hypothetical protein
VHHTNTAHPHVHVIVAGAGRKPEEEERDTSAKEHKVPVVLSVREYQVLRQSGRERSEYAWHRLVKTVADVLEQEDDMALVGGELPGGDVVHSRSEGRPFLELLPEEGRIGTYRELTKYAAAGDHITPHHMPAASYMKRHGVGRDAGICLNMEHYESWPAGRHRVTRSYGSEIPEEETPRQALARDIADVRAIYQSQELYSPKIRQALQGVIRLDKESFPDLFRK